MTRFLAAIALTFVSFGAFAQAPIMTFDPPNPTTRTPVRAVIAGLWGDGCPPLGGTATVTNNRIVITLAVSQNPCPIRPIIPIEYRVSVELGVLPAGVYTVTATVPGVVGEVASAVLTVREEAPELVVAPSVAFTTQRGSGKVRIRANGIGTCLPTVSPCRPPVLTVTFNGIASPSVVILSPDEIEAVLPNVTGTAAEVEVRTDDGRRVFSKAALLLVAPAGLADTTAFERILVPVVFEGPGAGGSQWTTDAYIQNRSNFAAPFFNPPTAQLPCALPEGCTPPFLAAGATWKIPASYPTGLYVYPARGTDVRLNVLVRDLSRQSEALGTEVPVVRENDWYSRGITLLNVPGDPRFRVTIRVYLEGDVDRFRHVPVRVFRLTGTEPLLTMDLSLDRSYNGTIPATNWIPNLHSLLTNVAPTEPLRVEIDPPQTGERFWAFATVTNNATQHVTVISPQ